MEAPLCRTCKTRHWGACANSPSARALKPAAPPPVAARKPAKPPERRPARKAKPDRPKRPPTGGRPLASQADKTVEHAAPWKKMKISRRTYYRRKAAGKL